MDFNLDKALVKASKDSSPTSAIINVLVEAAQCSDSYTRVYRKVIADIMIMHSKLEETVTAQGKEITELRKELYHLESAVDTVVDMDSFEAAADALV